MLETGCTRTSRLLHAYSYSNEDFEFSNYSISGKLVELCVSEICSLTKECSIKVNITIVRH